MDQNANTSPREADPSLRSQLYLLLTRVYRYPTAEFYVQLRDGEFVQELHAALVNLSYVNIVVGEWKDLERRIRRSMEELSFSEYENRFVQIFEVGTPQAPCPLYEGFNINQAAPRNRVMLELSEFYRNFGLALSKEEGRREMPDHICCELEFLHFLTFKEDQARENEDVELLEGYVLAQRDFLRRHPASWVPLLAQRVEEAAAGTPFGLLSDLTSRFLQRDLALVESHLEEMDVQSPVPPPISRGGPGMRWVGDNGKEAGCSYLPE